MSSESASTTAPSTSTRRRQSSSARRRRERGSIRLTSAVTVLSSADPVRVFQNFATLDLVSQGRAEMVVGRGSFIESFPLFGLRLEDYDSLFAEKLDLLLQIRDNEHVHWSGKHRPPLTGQGVYPRPAPGPAADLARSGRNAELVRSRGRARAAADGRDHRWRGEALPAAGRPLPGGRQARGTPVRAAQGRVHAPGYVAATTKAAADDFFPGWASAIASVAKERGWPPVTRADFDAQRGPEGALLVGSPQEVAEKVAHHSEALGGISRVSFQMNPASLPHSKLMRAIEAVGEGVAPALRGAREAA